MQVFFILFALPGITSSPKLQGKWKKSSQFNRMIVMHHGVKCVICNRIFSHWTISALQCSKTRNTNHNITIFGQEQGKTFKTCQLICLHDWWWWWCLFLVRSSLEMQNKWRQCEFWFTQVIRLECKIIFLFLFPSFLFPSLFPVLFPFFRIPFLLGFPQHGIGA